MAIKNHLLLFYLVTLVGSALTSFTVYLCIEAHFQHIAYLTIALVLGTISSAVFSCITPFLLRQITLKNAFIYSQIFGFFSVLLIMLGFYLNNIFLVLAGLSVANLPGCLVAILLTIVLKHSADSDMDYRKYSGGREFIFGASRMAAVFFSLAFSILRDDYIIKTGEDPSQIAAYSSFSMLQRYFFFSISPILLTLLFTAHNIAIAIFCLVFFQFLFGGLSCFFQKEMLGYASTLTQPTQSISHPKE